MKIVINTGEIGSDSVVYPDEARVAFEGIMSVYDQLPSGILETLEMVRFAPNGASRDVPYPYVLEVTLCHKLRGPSSTCSPTTIAAIGFNADVVKKAMLQVIAQLINGLSHDVAQLQISARQALDALKSTTAIQP